MNDNHQHAKKTRTPFARLNMAAVGIVLLVALPALGAAETSVVIRTPESLVPGPAEMAALVDTRAIAKVLDSLAGEGDGDDGENNGPPTVVILDSQHVLFGHWEGVLAWYKITNDADPNNRYYITTAQWYGMGSSGQPTEHGIEHLDTDVHHVAGAYGSPFFLNKEPLTVNPYQGTATYTVGMDSISASYSWAQTGPAYLRYDTFFHDYGDYSQYEYASAATYVDTQTTDKLEWAATGVIPIGGTGSAWILINDHSKACAWSCDHYYDSTGWRGRSIDWA